MSTQLAERRKHLGLSRLRLANMAGLTEAVIWRMENRGNWSPDELAAVDHVLATYVPPQPVEKPKKEPGRGYKDGRLTTVIAVRAFPTVIERLKAHASDRELSVARVVGEAVEAFVAGLDGER